jgi:2-dehydro-3-deoxygluconokinase
MIIKVKNSYPNVEVFANTLREVESANKHYWGAIVLENDQWTVIEPRPIEVLDRIGGGDAFVGGLLYGLLRNWPSEKAAQFGWASGAFVATLLDDFGTPTNEDQLWSIWQGNARVKR